MVNKELRSSLLLLVTAAIWGFAFVAQRVGMQYVGAFTFNGIRFALGSVSLIPVIHFVEKKRQAFKEKQSDDARYNKRKILKYGTVAGGVLFIAATLQQVGLIYTTAGKAGFITSLYIVLVPILGVVIKQKSSPNIWTGALIAAIGLYFLSINEDLRIEFGDFLQLAGAFFWAVHILVIGVFVSRVDALRLSSIQFAVCSLLSFLVAILFEEIQMSGIISALVPILYGGLMSVGVAYTLQVVAQRHAKASHAAIALSMEAVFAALGGMLLLSETLPLRGYLGSGLMLIGMLISQADNFGKKAKEMDVINEWEKQRD